jgi:arsenate reductase (thioredoxin)
VLPGAIQALAEIGIDISDARSKSMLEFLGQPFDYVLTVCDNAAENCPVFPGPGQRYHRDFTDPAKYSPEEQIAVFRRVRDEMGAWLTELFDLDA